MAKKELTLVIRARNAVAAGFRSVQASIAKFGSRIRGAFTGIFSNLMNIYAGIKLLSGAMGGLGKVMGEFTFAEKAYRQLATALAASGENAAEAAPKLAEIANQIQAETGYSDDAAVAMMARMKILGVATDKLGEAARASIGLASAGLNETAAMKAVAMAMQGNYDMLKRYVPALRTATSETEKQRIVNELFTKGYAQQKETLKTTSGAWAAFKGRIGDAFEEFGRIIERSFGIRDALTAAADKVNAFNERVRKWIVSEQFLSLQRSIQAIVRAMASTEGRKDVLDVAKSIGNVILAALLDGATFIHDKIREAFGNTRVGKALGAVDNAVGTASRYWGGMFAADGSLKERHERGVAAMAQEPAAKPESRLAGALEKLRNSIEETTGKHGTEARTEDSAPPTTESLGIGVDVDADEAVETDKESLKKIEAEHKRLNEELERAEKDALQDAWERQKNAAEKELKLAEETARKKVAEYIREAREKKKKDDEEARQDERDAVKAAALQERQARGGRLSKKQQEWLEAWEKIQAARGQLNPLRDQIAVAEDNLQQLRQTGRDVGQIRRDIAELNKRLPPVLVMG